MATEPMSDDDAMAAEWAAALAESKPGSSSGDDGMGSALQTETVAPASFTLEVGETSGSVHFCIPYSTLEPIRDVLYSTIQGDSVEPDRRWINLLKTQIQSAEVDLVAELGTAPATVEPSALALKMAAVSTTVETTGCWVRECPATRDLTRGGQHLHHPGWFQRRASPK